MVQQWNYFIPVGFDDSSLKRSNIDDAAMELYTEHNEALEMMPVIKDINCKHRNTIVINLIDQIDLLDDPNQPGSGCSLQDKQTEKHAFKQLESSNNINISTAASYSTPSLIATTPSPDTWSHDETTELSAQGLLQQNQKVLIQKRIDELTTENDELKAEVTKLRRYYYMLNIFLLPVLLLMFISFFSCL